MHPNPAFRGQTRDENLAFARARGFGVLTMAGADGPLAAHVPFALSEDGARLEAHLAVSNPILRALAAARAGEDAQGAPALMAVVGPDAYISPDWYGVADQVPTWNYVAVHLRGRLRAAPPESLRAHLDRLSADFEARIGGKAPWTTAKMGPGVMERMMRMIRPVEMEIADVAGTWKLSQNKSGDARLGAVDGLAAGGAEGAGAEIAALTALMRAVEG